MYKHVTLVAFVKQWTPTVPFPVSMTRIIYDFTEYLGYRVRVDNDELVKILIEHEYTVDRETRRVYRGTL